MEDRGCRGQNICKREVMMYIGRSRELINRWRIEAVEARTSVKYCTVYCKLEREKK